MRATPNLEQTLTDRFVQEKEKNIEEFWEERLPKWPEYIDYYAYARDE